MSINLDQFLNDGETREDATNGRGVLTKQGPTFDREMRVITR